MSVLEFSEKFIVYNRRDLTIREPNKVIKTTPVNIPEGYMNSYHPHDTLIGRINDRIILVGRTVDYDHNDQRIVMKFDSNLKLLGQYYITTIKNVNTFDIMKTIIGEFDYNWYRPHPEIKDKEGLPYGLKIGNGSMEREGEVVEVCYDNYDDTMVIILGAGFDIYDMHDCEELEIWEREREDDSEKWVLDRKIDDLRTVLLNAVDQTLYGHIGTMSPYHLACSKNYIIFVCAISDHKHYDHYVFIFDKYTLKLKDCIPGTHAIFHCDYNEWFTQSFELLKQIIMRLPDPLLRITLSYIS